MRAGAAHTGPHQPLAECLLTKSGYGGCTAWNGIRLAGCKTLPVSVHVARRDRNSCCASYSAR